MMERHQMNPGMVEMSRAHADLRVREMTESVGAERALRPQGGEQPGWLARAVAQGMVGLGGLMVSLGKRLADSPQAMQVSQKEGGC